ncbi:MAG: oligosaccharide flippase family protein [Candidatus Paceibacterota bacterium]|nr:oligosaccharide flippase family protein [Candidatus Paceibacterota bacterium]
MTIKEKTIKILRWSEKYTKTDMIYLAKGGFWLSFTTLIVSLMTFIKMIVFGRFLPQDVYGTYSYIIAVSGILALFSLPGIETAVIKSIAQKKDGTFYLGLKTRLKWGLIGSGLSLLLSIWYFVNQNSILGTSFLIVAFFLPSIGAFNLFYSFWHAKKKFETYAKYEILASIFIAIVIIPVVFLTNNVVTIILLLFLSQFIIYGIITRKTIKSAKNKEEDKKAISFGKDLTVMSTISFLSEYIDKIIIWKFLGPVQVAIYSFAQMPIYRIYGLIPISSLALPKLGERNIREIKKEIMKKFKKLFLASFSLTLFLILIAPLFYKILLPNYIESIPYFQAFSLIIALSPFGLIGSAIISEGKRKDLYILNTITPLLKIILFFVFVPFYGIWGIITAILISRIAGGFLTLYFFNKI